MPRAVTKSIATSKAHLPGKSPIIGDIGHLGRLGRLGPYSWLVCVRPSLRRLFLAVLQLLLVDISLRGPLTFGTFNHTKARMVPCSAWR